MNVWKTILCNNFLCNNYSIDMVRDYSEIICTRLMLFSGRIEEIEENRAHTTVKSLIPHCKQIHNRNRMYIVSGIQYLSFACTEISDMSAEKILLKLKSEFEMCDIMPIDQLEPNLVSAIYIFRDESLIFCENIYPAHLASLLNSLQSYNQIKCFDFEV